jgi:hypothetical protein
MTSFQTGAQAIRQAIEEGKRRSDAITAGSGKSPNYFGWKPRDKKIIRFLADDMITADFYDFIVVKNGTTMSFLVDPAAPDLLEQFRSPSPGIGWRKNPRSGVLEEPKPRKLSVCMAVLRTEVRRDSTMVIEDYLYDRDADDTQLPARFFGIVQQGINNFWHTLAISCVNRYGTIVDRDYEITRSGEGFDTKYDIIPLPPVPELTDPDVVKRFYSYGEPWNANDPKRFLKCPMTTLEWATYFSGEERYRFWLTPEGSGPPSSEPSGIGEFHPATTSNPAHIADEAQATNSTMFATLQQTLIEAADKK